MPEPRQSFTIDCGQVLEGIDLSQYGGIWAVDDTRFLSEIAAISTLDIGAHIAAAQTEMRRVDGVPMLIDDGVAVIDIQGSLTKAGSSLSGGGSLIRIRQKIRAAAESDDISAIVLRIDSPGGSVSGTQDVGNEVARAAGKKKVVAFVEDLAASAAYWIASQATEVVANNPTALIGSIGAYMALYDLSAQAGQLGIKPVVIKAGKFKAAGFPGTEVTDEQKAIWQELIDQTQSKFNSAIASGRKMSIAQVETLALGRVWMADEARDLGLIDAIKPMEQVITELRGKRRGSRKESTTMSDQKTPATAKEIRETFPNATAEFRESCLVEELTISEAKDRYMRQLAEQNEQLTKERDEAKADQEKARAEAAATKPARPGVVAVETAEADISFDDPIAEWEGEVDKKVAAGMTRQRAVSTLAKQKPELHEAYVVEYNRIHAPKRRKRVG